MKELISNFLEQAEKKTIIAIVGPTGSGKTDLSIQIAKEFNGEVINADSKQLYQGLPITTGLITEDEKQEIPHHLFAYLEPNISYSVEDHRRDALKCIEDIYKREKLPILVGGTGLFINTLTQNFDIPKGSYDQSLRDRLEEKSSEELWSKLNEVDPQYAEITHMNNRVRVIRALEYFTLTGKKKSEATKSEAIFDTLILMPEIRSREDLYEKINKRAEWMWKNGTLNEARILFDQKLDEKLPALTSIGIPEAFAFFRNEIAEEEALWKMQQKSRNYAKRQLTWWRNDKRVQIIKKEK